MSTMGLAEFPDDVKLEIFNKLETADKFSVRLVSHNFKDVVDQTKMHYDVLDFDCSLSTIKVSLSVPGGEVSTLVYEKVKEGQYTVCKSEKPEENFPPETRMLFEIKKTGKLPDVLPKCFPPGFPLPKRFKKLRKVEEEEMETKEGCFLEAAVRKFMEVLLKPRNTFGLLRIFPGYTLNPRNQEETRMKQKFLAMLHGGLATLNHQIPVEKLFMKVDNYRQITETIRHLVPGHLKRIAAEFLMFSENTVNQSELNELAGLEQFWQAKQLEVHNILLSLPHELTDHFTDLRCEEQEFQVERMDSIIEMFLRPNGWARRSFHFKTCNQEAVFNYLKNRALLEYNEQLEMPDGDDDEYSRTVTFRRGFHQCTVEYWGVPRRPTRDSVTRLKFTNRNLMLWKDVCTRPAVVTEEIVRKERERREEVKRQKNLRIEEEMMERIRQQKVKWQEDSRKYEEDMEKLLSRAMEEHGESSGCSASGTADRNQNKGERDADKDSSDDSDDEWGPWGPI